MLRNRGIATIRRRRERLLQHLDKVGREQPDRAWITAQTAHPPLSIAGIQRLDQVALDEAQILLRLAAPGIGRLAPAGKARQIARHAHSYRVQLIECCGKVLLRRALHVQRRGISTSSRKRVGR